MVPRATATHIYTELRISTQGRLSERCWLDGRNPDRRRPLASEPIFPAVRLASRKDLFVAGIRRRVLHRFSSRCGVLMLHANRSGDLGRHATPTAWVLDGPSRRSRRVRPHLSCTPWPRGASSCSPTATPPPRPPAAPCDGRVLLTITLAPQASAAAAPQCCSRRRLPPTFARFSRRRLARLLPAHGCSRCCPALRARPPWLASRSRAAIFRGRCCSGLLAPHAPTASRFVRRRHVDLTAAHRSAALLAGWSGSCHAISATLSRSAVVVESWSRRTRAGPRAPSHR